MKNNRNKRNKKIACLLVVFTLLLSYSPIFNNLFLNPNLSTIQEEDISVEWGDNVFQGISYTYSGTFYDDADFEFAWTTAEIEFEHPFSGKTYSHTITDLDNSEIEYPSNSSFTMVNGTHIQNGTLNALDDDYHIFNSTYDRTIAEQPFTIGLGSSDYTGDLEFLDGNYTTFTSELLPEAGHYNATYTFTDDADGSVPSGWTDGSGAGCSATIEESSIVGHKNSLYLYDNNDPNIAQISTDFTGQTSGTIEFWWMSTQNKYTFIKFTDGATYGIHLTTINTDYKYESGGWQFALDRINNVWFHHRIDFECGAGGYNGLSADTFDWYIDGNLVANGISFVFVLDNIDGLEIETWGVDIDSHTYFDAIGFSWDFSVDTGYEAIGDNWYYNYYFGNQTFEQYNTSSYGDFYGTYSFDDDTSGEVPDGWTDYSGVGSTAVVINALDGHRKVLELDDSSGTTISHIRQTFTTGDQTSGTVEFWLRGNSYSDTLYVIGDGGSDNAIKFYTGYDNGIYCYDPGWTEFAVFVVNTWYHIKVEFDCAVDWQIWVDGVDKGSYGFTGSPTAMDLFETFSRDVHSGYKSYVDALGYDWDVNYSVGNNFNPYGLEDLKDNGWEFDSGYGTTVRVTGEDTSHKKILELYDNSGTYSAEASYNFSNQATGTYEAWFKSDLDNKRIYIFIEDGNSNNAIKLRFGGGAQIQEDDGGGWANIQAYSADTWYHFRVEWDCADDWHLWIDDVSMDSGVGYTFFGAPMYMDAYHVYTEFTQNPITFSIDSLSFSWDDGYTIGDNMRAGDILDLIIEVNMNLDSFSNLNELYVVYAYRTNISLTCNYSIYNFDDSDYDVIENDINLAFVNSYFLLNSSYYNATNDIILSFVMSHIDTEFEMWLDRLLVRKPSYLNFSTTVNFDTLTGLLRMYINSYQRCNISQLINMSIWNYDTSSWLYLNGSSFITTFQLLQWVSDAFSNYIDSNGDVSLSYYGVNITDTFQFELDALSFTLWRKTIVQYDKILYLLDIWRYRFVLDEGLGTEHITDWIYFNVMVAIPNFHAISESDVSTRWILQGSDISAVEDFHDDINTNYWNLMDVSDVNIYINTMPTDDAFVRQDQPDINYGSNVILYMYHGGGADKETFIKYEFSYLTTNYTTNSIFTVLCSDNGEIDVYKTGDFSEGTIKWNNKPATGEYMDKTIITGGWGFYDIDCGEPSNYYQLTTLLANQVQFNSKEGTAGYEPIIKHYLTKNYFGDGYMYMQTDTTELISLKSQDYGTHYNLSSGDYFEVDFQTISDYQINLILLKDGIVQKTLTLSGTGNTNFNRHTAKISLSEFVEFDQLKISGTFEDTDYVNIYDIKTYKYILTGESADFCVDPDGSECVYLSPDAYNLRIFDPYDGDMKVNTNITIGSTDYYYVYEPIESIQCRITLFNTENEYLQFEDYHITINRSLNGDYNQFELVDTLFYADEETYVYINVSDRFNALIDTFSKLASSYIDLELEVYLLQIKNLQTQKTTVDINATHVYPLLSGDSIYFMLSTAYYQIGYYDTNDVYKQFTIYLNSNQAYELNRSKICFLSYTDQQGNHLYFEDYRTYLNGSLLYENMFYREIGDNIGIEIKDRYNISITNETYTVISGDNYIPIILTMYSLKVMSLQLVFNHVNITRDPTHYGANPYYWSTWLAPRETAEFKLFAGYYKINITNFEDGGWTLYDYTLSGDAYILIGSNNTIYNVLVNIANVNTTIGNQLTNIQINITNWNSAINASVINIEINLNNINSSLGTMLVDIDTAISNINTSIINEIVSLGTVINNINTSITNQILGIGVNITNMNSSIVSQLLTLGVDISNINGSIINQILALGVDVSNFNTSLSNQILAIDVDITNINTSIIDQILLVIADIENIETQIDDQTIVILADITNINSTLLNQMISLGVDMSNINVSITNQILSLNVDLININSTITNLLNNIAIDLTNIDNDIFNFYANVNTSFVNLNNVMNTSFIYLENNIISFNQSISNLVIGVSNSIYLINGTISTMITQMENNLLLMNVSINTNLINMDSTLSIIGANITNNYILLNNTLNLIDLNIDESRIAMINNLLLINNTISLLIADVYSAVYLINNSIYTAVVDLGTYLSLMNNTIYGNLSIILEMNEFLTEIYKMTMFSELLNWTNVGLNTSLLTSQIDAWTFINNYKDQAVEVHLRYQDLIEELIISADDLLLQHLPISDVEYREWSEDLQEYVGEWKALPENRTVNFGFYETEVPYDPEPLTTSLTVIIAFVVILAVGIVILVVSWYYARKDRDIVPKPARKKYKEKNKPWKVGTFKDTGTG